MTTGVASFDKGAYNEGKLAPEKAKKLEKVCEASIEREQSFGFKFSNVKRIQAKFTLITECSCGEKKSKDELSINASLPSK
jgi:hypothetical protein